MYERKIPEDLECGINVTARVVGGKWKPCILDGINRGIRRPSDLHREIPSTSPRVINMQLRELADYGIIRKKIYAGLPLKVEYFLTELGLGLLPLIDAMEKWGNKNKEHVKEVSDSAFQK